MASDVAGMGPASRSSERHAATAASWFWENWAVMSGGSIRSWYIARGAKGTVVLGSHFLSLCAEPERLRCIAFI